MLSCAFSKSNCFVIASTIVHRLTLSSSSSCLQVVQYCAATPNINMMVPSSGSSAQQSSYEKMLRDAFLASITSVKPKAIFTGSTAKCLSIDNHKNCLRIRRNEITENVTDGLTTTYDEYELSGRQCHLVGFGKAVLGMAVQIERVLGNRLQSGILSVPLGSGDKFKHDPDMQLCHETKIRVYEGAKNNLPDEKAAETAAKILELVRRLDANDLLIVAISGGGSALIPAPIAPVTLQEKRWLIKALADREATINEINAVRRRLSQTKGGRLAAAGHRAAAIISLIISDVSGDPLDIIASGPTVPFVRSSDGLTAESVLQKYLLFDSLPASILQVLSSTDDDIHDELLNNAKAYLIGNNQLAASTAVAEMRKNRFRTICLTTKCEGNVQILSECYAKIAILIVNVLKKEDQSIDALNEIFIEMNEYFHFSPGACDELCEALEHGGGGPICLIVGGEPTVLIQGAGLGGRNQELALRVSKLLASAHDDLSAVIFLAGGTDGIDGPTDAAGAIGCSAVISSSDDESVDDALLHNDSYNFYKKLLSGRYHLITGHTGTNVMDLHMMIIPTQPE